MAKFGLDEGVLTPGSGKILERWRSASVPEREILWADSAQRLALRAAWQQWLLPHWWAAAADAQALQIAADTLALLADAESLPPALLATALQVQEASLVQPSGTLPAALRSEAANPMPLDMEADTFAKAIEDGDLETLAPLLFSMAEDENARRIVLTRLAQRLADDNHAQGLRTILYGQWHDAAADLPAQPFSLGAMALLQSHWQLPAGVAVVVPEGRASRDPATDKPLLHALRDRDLPAFMGRIRALGDQPLDAIRQLFLTVTLMIIEGGGGKDPLPLVRLYVWLGSLLALPHRSLRQARKVLFSAAATTFGFAGWQRQEDWPDFSTLAAYRERAALEPVSAPFSWQRALYAAASGSGPQWWLQVAERGVAQGCPEGFWSLWRTAQRAGSLTGGPLAWIHPLVVTRLYLA